MKREDKHNNKLRICEFGQKSLYRVGGVEVVVYELATRMARMGHKVTCINRSGDQSYGYAGAKSKPSEIDGVRIKYAPTINKRGFAAMTSSVCASFMAAFGKYDVVHIHAEGPAILCWLPKLLGKKVIVTIHGLDHQRAKWGRLASWYIKTGEKNAVKHADEIIVLSRGVQDYFTNTYKRKTNYIPNGVSKPRTQSHKIINEKWGLEKDSYLLFLARICPEKGCHYLIDAFKHINTPKKLVIAGGSSDTNVYYNGLRELAKTDERIIFTGFVSDSTLDELYSNAYLYCLPSDLEGMPLSLLEAMSYGNCCLTSDIVECTEVIEDKAVTFNKSDISDLREKLKTLLNETETVNKYKIGAADFICKKYNWDDVVNRTVELYR